jgi:hypothetical protein
MMRDGVVCVFHYQYNLGVMVLTRGTTARTSKSISRSALSIEIRTRHGCYPIQDTSAFCDPDLAIQTQEGTSSILSVTFTPASKYPSYSLLLWFCLNSYSIARILHLNEVKR